MEENFIFKEFRALEKMLPDSLTSPFSNVKRYLIFFYNL
jgi:hypothetical protein